MRKVLVIARREYLAAVRTKAFILSLVVLPVVMVGSAIIQLFLEAQAATKDKHFAIIDRSEGKPGFASYKVQVGGLLASARLGPLQALPWLYLKPDKPPPSLVERIIKVAAERREATEHRDSDNGLRKEAPFFVERVEPSADSPEAIDAQRVALSERVLKGELTGFLEIGPDVYRNPGPEAGKTSVDQSDEHAPLRYQTNDPLHDAFPRWVKQVVNDAVRDWRCTEAGLDADRVRAVSQPVGLQTFGVSQRNPRTEAVEEASEASQLATLVLPFLLVSLMFLVIMLGANPLMQSVVEEKMQRIAEVLLGSVRPFELMMGKLLGMVAVALTVASVYLGGTYWAASMFHVTDHIPISVLAWFLVFQMLAVLMYGSLFIAVGAACTDMKETQALLLPVVLVACVPMFALPSVIREPNTPFATALSFVPVATPMLMIARQTVPPGVPWWQPVLGILGVLATTIACVYAAGRIFRVGILMQGKGARLSDLVKWVFRG
jgi:ABC-2 type transport system permease protein